MTHAFDVFAVPCDRRALIEASAGTGKTYAISTLFVRLLLERELGVDQILVVTFTEAATAELERRVRRRLLDALGFCEGNANAPVATDLAPLLERQPDREAAAARLRQALERFDEAAIFTIHGFCHRMLLDNAFQTGAHFGAELLQDLRPLAREVLLDFWARELPHASVHLLQRLREVGWTPNGLMPFANWVAGHRSVAVLPDEIQQQTEPDANVLDESYRELQRLFDAERIEFLLTRGNLDQRSFHKNHLPKRCAKLIEHFARHPRPSQALFDDSRHFSKRAIQAAVKKGAPPPEHPFFDAVDEFRERYPRFQEEMDRYVLTFKRRLFDTLQRELPRRKHAQGVVSYDDLLHQLDDALSAPAGASLARDLRRRFPVALIDEFQDTDPVQFSIFDRIYAGNDSSLFLIGDPKQAIYSFRGADVFAYLDAARGVPDAQRHTMPTNYRSAPALVQAVNLVFSQSQQPLYVPEIVYPEVGSPKDATQQLSLPAELDPAPLQFRLLRSEAREGEPPPVNVNDLPTLVAREVLELLRSGARLDGERLTPKSFAVLTRTNAQAFDCQRALHALRIPAVVLGDRSVFEQPDAADLETALGAILEPGNVRAIRAALVTPLIGLDGHDLLALDGDEAAWEKWMDRFRSWNQRWLEHGFVQMIRKFIDDCDVAERLLKLADGERRMTNLLHLIELLHTESAASHLGPNGVLHTLRERKQAVSQPSDAEQVRLESDEDAVVLTTVHKSKGLEYPIVLLPYSFRDFLLHPADEQLIRFHDTSDEHHLTLDLGSDQLKEHTERMRLEALAENHRLAYVGLTRAKHRCIVHWGKLGDFKISALGCLLFGKEAAAGAPVPSLKQLSEHLKELGDEQHLEHLRALDPSGELIGVSEVATAATLDPNDVWQPAAAPAAQFACREVQAQLRHAERWPRTASFSSLTAHELYTPRVVDALEGRDYDQSSERATELSMASTERVTLADFVGGKTTGNFFHALLEHCDFTATDHGDSIERTLRAHGYREELAPLVNQALGEILTTELAPGLSLSRIANSKRLNELEFTLATRAGSELGLPQPVTPAAIARAFEQHPSEVLPPRYAKRLGELGFRPLLGFLKGFVDLIFVHQRRWYVVDYKTNDLGEGAHHYTPSALVPPMLDHHYVLQYHCYTLALHRYLGLRLADYDYERDFGGVYYLFLRGMHPARGARTGVFFEKPPLARVEALSELFRPTASQTSGITR